MVFCARPRPWPRMSFLIAQPVFPSSHRISRLGSCYRSRRFTEEHLSVLSCFTSPQRESPLPPFVHRKSLSYCPLLLFPLSFRHYHPNSLFKTRDASPLLAIFLYYAPASLAPVLSLLPFEPLTEAKSRSPSRLLAHSLFPNDSATF